MTVTPLTGTGDFVNIVMTQVDVTAELPRITQITLPAEILASTANSTSTATVDITVGGTVGDTLSFAFTSPAAGGTFAAVADVTLASPTATVTATYTAPIITGSPSIFTHTVEVTNQQGISVKQDFDTTVVFTLTTTQLNTEFSPVVTSISVKRTGTDVTWTATANDDGPQEFLVFIWSFAQTAGLDCPPTCTVAFTAASAFTPSGVLAGYDETVEGTVSLVVGDAGGEGAFTAISLPLVAGQFPDNVVVVTPSTLTLDAFDRGWWRTNQHIAINQNTLTGNGGNDFNSYFQFSLTGVTGTVTAALLRLEIAEYVGDASETLSIWDVSTTSALLDSESTLNTSTVNAAVHNDLEGGLTYGSFNVTLADVDVVVDIPLNAQAVDDIGTAIIDPDRNSIAVGIFLDTNPTFFDFLKFSLGDEVRTHQLVLTVVQ